MRPDGPTVTNAGLEKKNFNDQDDYGGRAALKIDLDDNWTVDTDLHVPEDEGERRLLLRSRLGDLKIDRFRKETSKDRFWQAALTVQGKIANFDVTYAGAYMDRPTSGSTITPITRTPTTSSMQSASAAWPLFLLTTMPPAIRQQPAAVHHRHQPLQEAQPGAALRVAGGQAVPGDRRRFLSAAEELHPPGLQVDDLAPDAVGQRLSGTLWLTQQKREDKDYALFGEASCDVTPQITLTAGGRLFKYDNSLIGFFGFGRDPAYFQDDGRPFTAAERSRQLRTGVAHASPKAGDTAARFAANAAPIRRFCSRPWCREARAPTSACSRTASSCRSARRTAASRTA